MSLTTPPASVDLLREQCNRLVSGQCSLRKCMVRGGWVGGETNYDKATCEYREAVMAMQRQPIATAPTDGTRIIGYDRAGGREMWFVRDQYEGEFWRDEFDSEPEPSHWTPLPSN